MRADRRIFVRERARLGIGAARHLQRDGAAERGALGEVDGRASRLAELLQQRIARDEVARQHLFALVRCRRAPAAAGATGRTRSRGAQAVVDRGGEQRRSDRGARQIVDGTEAQRANGCELVAVLGHRDHRRQPGLIFQATQPVEAGGGRAIAREVEHQHQQVGVTQRQRIAPPAELVEIDQRAGTVLAQRLDTVNEPATVLGLAGDDQQSLRRDDLGHFQGDWGENRSRMRVRASTTSPFSTTGL